MAVMRELSCADLRIADCDYVARGETARGVLEDMVEHLEADHDLDLPDVESILVGDEVDYGEDERVRLIVARMQEELNIKTEEEIDREDVEDIPTGRYPEE